MAGAASQTGDADSSRVPGLTSGLQGSVNVHRGALLLVPQLRCTSSYVFTLIFWKHAAHVASVSFSFFTFPEQRNFAFSKCNFYQLVRFYGSL